MKEILSMIKNHHGIQGMLDENNDKWQNFPAFVSGKKRLDDLLEQSDLLRGVIGNKSNSITQSKNLLKTSVLEEVMLIADALTAFAEENENSKLLLLLSTYNKRLKRVRRDIEVYDSCAAFIEFAAPYQTDLIDYRITALMFESAKELLKDYKKHVSLPNTVIKSNKSSKENLHKNTKAISKLLKNRMDRMVKLLAKEHPELAEKYFALRKLNKVARKKRKDNNSNQPQTA